MNIFSRLCSYSFNKQKLSKENFVTEVMAHLFNHDRTFRRIFLRHVLRDGRVRGRFRNAEAHTQVQYPRCIIDLVLKPRSRQPLFVEIKLTASETQTKIHGRGWVPQIEKYLSLRRGPVVYLTSTRTSAPVVRRQPRYLGHYTIEDLHASLAHATTLTPFGREFVRFMEDQGMVHPEPFTKRELRHSRLAFAFALKCIQHLNALRADYGRDFARALRTNVPMSRAGFNAKYGSAYTIIKGFKRGPFRSAGFSIETYGRQAWFYVWFRTYIDEGSDVLPRKAGFEKSDESSYWVEELALTGGPADRGRMERCVERAIKRLRKVI